MYKGIERGWILIQARMEMAKEGTQPCLQGCMKPEELEAHIRQPSILGGSYKAAIKPACAGPGLLECMRCKDDTGPNNTFPGLNSHPLR